MLWSNSTVPPLKKKGVRYPLVGNLLYQVTFFSRLIVSSSHCVIPTSHVTVLFSHYAVPLLFFLTFDGFILTLCSSNITCDAKGLVAELASPHVQSAWGFKGKGFELRG